MSNPPETNRQHRRLIRLMLIEDDPVFRLGLVAALEQVPDLRIVFEADTGTTALRVLQDWMKNPVGEGVEDGAIAPELILMSLDLGQSRTGRNAGVAVCEQIKALFPQIPILLLSARQDPLQLATAMQTGAEGYCPKGVDIQTLVSAIRQVAAGQTYWSLAMQTISQALTAAQVPAKTTGDERLPSIPPTAPSETDTPLAVLRRNLRQSGTRQIDAAIALLSTQLQNPNLSPLDELILAGRHRELRAARWLVNRLLAPPRRREPSQLPSSPSPPLAIPTPSKPGTEALPLPSPSTSPTPGSTSLTAPTPTSLRSIRAALFDMTAARLQTSLRNLTETPLEIDILREEKKRELLYTILRKLEDVLDDLRFSQVSSEQLEEKQTVILLDLWQTATTDFFGKYYTLQLNNQPIEIVNVLLRDADVVQTGILDKIPLMPEFLAHLLFQTPLTIDDTSYETGTVEAMRRMEMLLQNLIVQVANGVMQPLLNRFGNVETIKRNFYDKRLLSTREIERFRNNLSWRYRMEQYFGEPTAIFESRYDLFTLQEGGITRVSIYSPRNEELTELSGIPLAVTLALEARDAIAPRLRSAISFVGSGVVYLLTDVIGRGIGLIGRGIIKGIGNAFQDGKFSRNSERSR
jgi:DNA-binding NarL/FixJ family response regulator